MGTEPRLKSGILPIMFFIHNKYIYDFIFNADCVQYVVSVQYNSLCCYVTEFLHELYKIFIDHIYLNIKYIHINIDYSIFHKSIV